MLTNNALGQAPQPGLATLLTANNPSKVKTYELFLNPSAAVDLPKGATVISTGMPTSGKDMMAAAWAGEMLHIDFYSKGTSLPHHSRSEFQQAWEAITQELGFPSMPHGND